MSATGLCRNNILKFSRFLKVKSLFNSNRYLSQYYPIDEYIYGLTEQQKEVSHLK